MSKKSRFPTHIMNRILVIANKTWEVDPLLNALLNSEFKADSLKLPDILNQPRRFDQGKKYIPRAVYDFDQTNVEIWCIQDLMDPKKNPSSSEEKNRIMPYIFSYDKVSSALVIAFGTAAVETDESKNGCVSIGSNIFISNAHPNGSNPESKWDDDRFGKLIESKISDNFFKLFGEDYENNVELRLLKPPLHPADSIRLLIDKNYLGLSNVNITDYSEYKTKDQEGIEAVKDAGIKNVIASVETTHGVIRLQSDAPFIFISGITDREGYFDTDVSPKPQAQNYTAAFNAGIAVAWLIPKIVNYFPKNQ